MNPRCDQLGPFFDNKLSDKEHAAFRDHLAACHRCRSGLHEIMQLAEIALELILQAPRAMLEPMRGCRGARRRS
jgi:anti-sigma factor RsiW